MSGKSRPRLQSHSPKVTYSPLVQSIHQLQRSRNVREKRQLYYAEGIRNLMQLATVPERIEKIIYSKKLLKLSSARQFVRQAKRSGTSVVAITPEEFRQFFLLKHASGVAMIVRQHWTPLEQAIPADRLGWIVLEEVQSGGNFGTLIRTCEALGAAGFLLIKSLPDPFAPDVVRATMGACFHQKYVRCTLEELASWKQQHGVSLLAASPDGQKTLHQTTFSPNSAIVLGTEKDGLSDPMREICDQLIQIPMTGTADSLNLGVAGSLFIAEKLRCYSEVSTAS